MFTSSKSVTNQSSTESLHSSTNPSSTPSLTSNETDKDLLVRISIQEDKLPWLKKFFPAKFYSIVNKLDFMRKASLAVVNSIVSMVENSLSRIENDDSSSEDSEIDIHIHLKRKSIVVRDILLYSMRSESLRAIRFYDKQKFEEADPHLVIAALQFNLKCNAKKAQDLLKYLIYKNVSYIVDFDRDATSLIAKKMQNETNFKEIYQASLKDAQTLQKDNADKIRKNKENEEKNRIHYEKQKEDKRRKDEEELRIKLDKLFAEQQAREKAEQEAKAKEEKCAEVSTHVVSVALNRAKSIASVKQDSHRRKVSAKVVDKKPATRLKTQTAVVKAAKPYLSPLKKPLINDPEKKPFRKVAGKFAVIKNDTLFDKKLPVVKSHQEAFKIYAVAKKAKPTVKTPVKMPLVKTGIAKPVISHSETLFSKKQLIKTSAGLSHLTRKIGK